MPVNPTEQTKLTSKLCNANWVAADIQRVSDLLPPKHVHSEHWVEIYSTLLNRITALLTSKKLLNLSTRHKIKDLPLVIQLTNQISAQANKGKHQKAQYPVSQVLPSASWVTMRYCQFREDLSDHAASPT